MMKLAPSGAVLMALAAMCACSEPPRVSRSLSDEQIIKALNERVTARACCFYVGEDEHGSVYGPLNASREIRFIIRRSVGGDDVACGFSRFPDARAFNGSPMRAGGEAFFVVRNQRLFLATDMEPEAFDRLQDQLCGPAWVKPMPGPPPVY